MRTFLLIVAVLMSQIGAWAQGVPTATLHQGGEFKTFYSANALRQALAEAQPGAIINLSAGSFKGGCTISVPVSVRGIGVGSLSNEAVSNSGRTVILDVINVNVPEDAEGKTVSMEGMECETIKITEAPNSVFSKMLIKSIQTGEGEPKMENISFIHCVLDNFYFAKSATLQLFNCVLTGFRDASSADLVAVNNCIVNMNPYQTDDRNTCVYTNCIFNMADQTQDWKYCSAYNCVALNGEEDTFQNENAQAERNNRLFPEGMDVFVEGTYYKLTEEAAKYLGNDGTQVGIYGTSLPFSVTTSYPQIKKFMVAPESTSDGKLKIEIEIDANN